MKCIIHRDQDALFNCFICRNPICVDCARDFGGRSVCPVCIARREQSKAAAIEAETKDLKCPCACVMGLLAAGAVAFAWSQLVVMTGHRLDALALLLGALVAFAVMRGAGGKRGQSLQQIAFLVTLVGVLFGYFLILMRTRQAEYLGLATGGGDALGALYAYPGYLSTLGASGWMFLAAAAGLAYHLPRPRSLGAA